MPLIPPTTLAVPTEAVETMRRHPGAIHDYMLRRQPWEEPYVKGDQVIVGRLGLIVGAMLLGYELIEVHYDLRPSDHSNG